MTSLRLFVGLWLLAAPGAWAQRAALPASGVGRIVMAAPIPQLSAPPALTPAASLAPALAAPAFSPAPFLAAPAPLKLAAVDAAVVQFSALDLKSEIGRASCRERV